jgi:bifunctional pyridoxal-dependent enzyme with beta-cystathionase and maltose regulon repressor activities
MASFLNDNFNPFAPVTGKQILTAGGVTPIEDMLAMNLGDPGDGILVSSPIYGRFELDFGNEARLKIVYADMKGVDSFSEAVVGRFERAMENAKRVGTRIRALLISNPSNPLGTSFRAE